jgi:hypothetical protein
MTTAVKAKPILHRVFTDAKGQGCVRCGAQALGGVKYGEDIDIDGIHGFTGWRGPYCGVKCYRADYPDEATS